MRSVLIADDNRGLGSALKLALIESLRRLAEDLLEARDSREAADRYLARLNEGRASPPDVLPEDMLSSAFVAQILHRSREYGERGGAVRSLVEEYLAT